MENIMKILQKIIISLKGMWEFHTVTSIYILQWGQKIRKMC